MKRIIAVIAGVALCCLMPGCGNSPQKIKARYQKAMESNDAEKLVAITTSDPLNLIYLNDIRDEHDNNIMVMALLQKKPPEVIDGLIQAGFDVSRHDPLMEVRFWDRRSILTVAIASGYDAGVIHLLLGKGAWYIADPVLKTTPFEAALARNDIEIITLLLYCLNENSRDLFLAFDATLDAGNTEALNLIFNQFKIPYDWILPLVQQCDAKKFDTLLKIFTPAAKARLLQRCQESFSITDTAQLEFLLARGAVSDDVIFIDKDGNRRFSIKAEE